MSTPQAVPQVPPRKRAGFLRLWFAFTYSLAGLRAAWGEPAFRLEAIVATVLLPLAFWLARSWIEGVLLLGSVFMVLIVELLNSALETAIDRIGPEWHLLSKRAKDMGSAAVLLSLVLAGGIWLTALLQRFTP
jgi:diacylglycerol kinase (ATP)